MKVSWEEITKEGLLWDEEEEQVSDTEDKEDE